MKRTTCSFCGRKFTREVRALISEKFCQYCIEPRIKASGGQRLSKNNVLTEVKPGYFIIKQR